MKIRLSSWLSIVLLGVIAFNLVGNVETALAASFCNAASFVADVTIPDGTYINPGAPFTKTWRLKNVGTCAWKNTYSLVFSSGEQMGGASPIFLGRFVSPGQQIDLTVDLVAPTTGGTFRGYWMLQTNTGTKFGVGAGGFRNPFWVEIRVLSPASSVVAYDFVSNMCSGQWGYEGGPIPCPVNQSKRDFGYVEKLDNPLLENGQPAGAPALLTVPQNKFNGAIHGAFPVDDIFRGDHFQAIIGCQFGAVNCDVIYQLEYLVAGNLVTLWKFRERYDGIYEQIDVDLTPIANRGKAQFVLTVWSNGPNTGDQPLWVAPRIVRQVLTPGPTPVPPTPTPPIFVGTGTPTPIPGVTPGTPGCDRAQFVSDVTIPDGTTFAPNTPFTKVWRLMNAGTCTWTTGYSLTFVSGDRMSGTDSLLPQTVVPGQTVDIGINLTAPPLAGSYRGYWALKNTAGQVFGIGSTFDQPFFVSINVSGTSTTGQTVLDFVNSVCTAQWTSGAGTLPCLGSDGDPRGFVLSYTAPVLENGVAASQPGILTFPQNTLNGYIQGKFPTYTIQSGDHFQATLNCQYGATTCFVIFQFGVQISGGATQNLLTIGEKYDGLYYPVDVDLSSLAGKNVNFVLTVLANGDATGDRAMWVGPRIVRNPPIGGGTDASPTATPEPPTATPVPPPTATPQPSSTSTGWNSYQDAVYSFSFGIPPGSVITSQTDTSGHVDLPFTSGTNLAAKYIDVSVAEGATTCKSPSSTVMSTATTVTINGISFLKETGQEGAMSHLYQWTAYSTTKDTACISLLFMLRSVSPGVFETPPPVFDMAAESAIFSTIMSTYTNL